MKKGQKLPKEKRSVHINITLTPKIHDIILGVMEREYLAKSSAIAYIIREWDKGAKDG